jgi:hypothetical protein
MSVNRPIRLPEIAFAEADLPAVPLQPRNLLRIHSGKRDGAEFRLSENHRFSHPDAPGGLLYLGENFETCAWERFGDIVLEGSGIGLSVWNGCRLSRIGFLQPLDICDLTELATRRALGVDLSALEHTNLDIPQAWGLAVQTHPSQPDGLRYLSRFTDKPCIALFDRPGISAKLSTEPLALLPDLDEAGAFLETHRIALV